MRAIVLLRSTVHPRVQGKEINVPGDESQQHAAHVCNKNNIARDRWPRCALDLSLAGEIRRHTAIPASKELSIVLEIGRNFRLVADK